MRSKSPHSAQVPQTQNRKNASSDGHRRTDKPGAISKSRAEKPATGDAQSQPTPEQFGERGMGMAAKE